MNGRRGIVVPGSEGRTLQLRPAHGGEGVQLGILGRRGSLVEAFCAELTQVPALIFGLDSVSEVAWAEWSSRRPVLPFGAPA